MVKVFFAAVALLVFGCSAEPTGGRSSPAPAARVSASGYPAGWVAPDQPTADQCRAFACLSDRCGVFDTFCGRVDCGGCSAGDACGDNAVVNRCGHACAPVDASACAAQGLPAGHAYDPDCRFPNGFDGAGCKTLGSAPWSWCCP